MSFIQYSQYIQTFIVIFLSQCASHFLLYFDSHVSIYVYIYIYTGIHGIHTWIHVNIYIYIVSVLVSVSVCFSLPVLFWQSCVLVASCSVCFPSVRFFPAVLPRCLLLAVILSCGLFLCLPLRVFMSVLHRDPPHSWLYVLPVLLVSSLVLYSFSLALNMYIYMYISPSAAYFVCV